MTTETPLVTREVKSMKPAAPTLLGIRLTTSIALALTALAVGCATGPVPTTAPTHGQVEGRPGPGEMTFDSDTAAVDAMVAAAKSHNYEQVHKLLGPAWKELVSGDKIEDEKDFDEFAKRAAEKSSLVKESPNVSILHVGNDDWPFPIPVAKGADGKWFFDTEAGKNELLARRIGENELDAIDICRHYVLAQREYASIDHDGSDVLKYAQQILSTPGKTDGLYWQPIPGQSLSPFDQVFAAAATQGYQPGKAHQRQPLYGYRFRVLKRQGSDAPGGKYDYVVNGNMVAGFALIAYPTDYGASGIMTFIINQNGKLYQKDLGPDTVEAAKRIKEYNPDSSWTLVKD
jgi:hypothetical protein